MKKCVTFLHSACSYVNLGQPNFITRPQGKFKKIKKTAIKLKKEKVQEKKRLWLKITGADPVNKFNCLLVRCWQLHFVFMNHLKCPFSSKH